ncbi:heme ABC transporter ATP-binding protein [Jonesiaceae bacterium BS-20]|uniref:Heme ABC transporter ATP-binding protein n=1 Tax=Jonesiaceae bacterium BS-20 TaxID=3120821 RepID=A0AAU7DXX7_9MICO
MSATMQDSATSTVALEAKNVVFEVPGKTILDGVSVAIKHGTVVALVGPNGAGKSTLLSVLAGDESPSAGEVYLDGKHLTDHKLAHLARKRAVLLQEQKLSFPFQVFDVVLMGRAPWRGLPQEDQDEVVVANAIEVGEVAHLTTRLFPTLSGGEKARVSFARVLSQQTKIIMLDEPTAALDIRHQEAVLAHARVEAAAGAAVVVVLHDLSLAAAYADEVVVLQDGHIAGAGSPREVFTTELLTEVYRYPIEVLDHPVTGELIVLPVRGGSNA